MEPHDRGIIAPLVLFVLAAVAVHLAIAGFLLPGVMADGMIETDGYMRLVRIQRLWETGGWFDSTLPRVNAPFGDDLNWTRPYDVLILLGAIPFAPFMTTHGAIHASAVASTPILMVGACLLAVWAVRPLIPSSAGWLAAVTLFAQAGVLMVSLPGRGDHHTLIILLVVLTLGAVLRLLLGLEPRRAAALTGIALALGMWASTEFLMVWAAALTALAVVWIARGGTDVARHAKAALGWASLATLLCLVLERGPDLAVVEFDKISPVHLGVAALGWATWWVILRATRVGTWAARPSGRLAIMVVAGLAAAFVLAIVFPGFFQGPWADLPPEERAFWFELVREYQPLLPTGDGLGTFIVFMGLPILALAYALVRVVRAWQRPTWPAWALLSCFLLLYVPFAIQSLRFAPLAQVPSAIVLAVALSAWFEQLDERYSRPPALLLKTGGTLTALLGFVVVGGLLVPETSGAVQTGGACKLDRLALILEDPNGLGSRPRIIFGHQDYSPELLYRTRHSVVATSFHRNVDAVFEVQEVLGGSDEAASRQALAERGVDLVLLCPDARGRYFRGEGTGQQAESLYGRLVRGAPPAWLQAVPLQAPGTEGFLLFQVVR